LAQAYRLQVTNMWLWYQGAQFAAMVKSVPRALRQGPALAKDGPEHEA